jgi:cyanophycin synthetase
VDYAHNPHGLEALARFAARLQRPGGRTIGMIGMPGDRRDEDIRAMGAIAAGFIDHLVLREDQDLRGRAPGEVSALIIEGTRQSGRKGITIETIRSEGDAADHCLEMARPGDIVLLTGEDVEELWRRARAFTCKPRDRSVRMAGWDVQRRTG